jgi:hypothetical protein
VARKKPMEFRWVYLHFVSVGLVQGVYLPDCVLAPQTIPWPAAAPLATVMSCQPCAAWQVKLLSVAYVVPITASCLLLATRSPSGAVASSTRVAGLPGRATATLVPSGERATPAGDCWTPGAVTRTGRAAGSAQAETV